MKTGLGRLRVLTAIRKKDRHREERRKKNGGWKRGMYTIVILHALWMEDGEGALRQEGDTTTKKSRRCFRRCNRTQMKER